MSDVVIRVENVSKLYRLGEVGTGSLAHDVNRWWHKVRGKEDPYLKIGEVNDRTKSAKQTSADGGSQGTNGTTNHTNKHENLTTIERQGGRENEQPKVGPKGEEVGTTESNGSDGHNQAPGQVCGRLSQGSPEGETIDHREKDCRRQPEGCSEAKSTGNERVKYGEAGLRLAGQAGAAFSNPSASQLARDSGNTSLTRCAGDPAGARIAPEDRPSEVADALHGPRRSKLETAEGGGEGTAGGNQRADSGGFLEGHSQAGLQMDSEKLAAIRSANASSASGARSTLDSGLSTPPSSVLIRDGMKSCSNQRWASRND